MDTPPFRFERLDHLVLRTADLPRLLSFYEQLGCTVECDRRAELGMVQLRLGVSMLDIVDAPTMAPAGQTHRTSDGSHNMDHFAVRIDPFDRDAILAFCASQGIQAHAPESPLLGADGLGPAVYITDPDGNRLELKGPPLS